MIRIDPYRLLTSCGVGVDASQSFDQYMSFLVSSPDWWGAVLAQYGVTTGAYDGA